MTKFFLLATLAPWMLTCHPVFAQSQRDIGYYLGGGLGYTKAGVATDALSNSLTRSGFSSVNASTDEGDRGVKAFGGYQFHRNFAIEGGYADLGKFSAIYTTTPLATATQKFKTRGFFADILAIWPFQNGVSMIGRAGAFFSETKLENSSTGALITRVASAKDTDTSYKLGLGFGYELNTNWGLRGEWERYKAANVNNGNADVDFFSLSLRYKF